MSNGRSFSRRRRNGTSKSIRKNQAGMQASLGMQRNLDKLAKMAGEMLTHDTTTIGNAEVHDQESRGTT